MTVVPKRDGILVPTNGSSQAFLLFPGYLPLGAQLLAGRENPQPTVAGCSASCQQRPSCTAFVWCQQLVRAGARAGASQSCAGRLPVDPPITH